MSNFEEILQPYTKRQYVPQKSRYSPTGVLYMNNVLCKRLETYLRPDRFFILMYIHCKTSICYEGAFSTTNQNPLSWYLEHYTQDIGLYTTTT